MSEPSSLWERALGFFVDAKLVVFAALALLAFAAVRVAPFEGLDGLGVPRDPVPVDAIPDVGENQQIVFTEWPGRSPRDVDDQITYPLTSALLGVAGVRTVRSSSALGFSTVYVIFDDNVDYYDSRTRVLEKLASLPDDLLPDGASPTLGPDATALGQVYWYTLEGRAPDGRVVGGFDLHELRAIQDWTVRPALASVEGVSEVSSIGGHVREYQVDVDPDALRAYGVRLAQVAEAVRASNLDVGARTLEINRVEYVVRGVGQLEELADLEATVVAEREHTPVRLRDVAHVHLGPALRRGGLDDAGAEVTGGVVVARYRENPRAVIEGVEARLAEIAPGLPRRTLEDGTVSQVTVVPFYDRSELIERTVGTLSTALWQQILITLIVVLVMLRRLRSSFLVAAILPLGVGLALVIMRVVGVDANVMALGGIAIAIGTMVDMGIVLTENVAQGLERAEPGEARAATVKRAAAEVAPAVLTSVLTTVVSFLPVFGLTMAESRLFSPLAYTKTFAMLGALALALAVLPALAHVLLRKRAEHARPWTRYARDAITLGLVLALCVALAADWSPMGPSRGLLLNALFVGAIVAGLLAFFRLFELTYPRLLALFLEHKLTFLVAPAAIALLGLCAWLGADRVFAWVPDSVRQSGPIAKLGQSFEGLGREYMPPFDEGAFLYMPTTMPHASVGEVRAQMAALDAAIAQIPEVDRVVGKWGRADSALDPAPISMFETLITYRPEYRTEPDGTRVRQWRDHIRTPRDIWDEVAAVAERPGLTGAPVLMPISTRVVMLQSGMRAPMGLKVRGPDLETIERFGRVLEAELRRVPQLRADTVFAEPLVGKPYLEITIDREAIARFGLGVEAVQRSLRAALGGVTLTHAVHGRERYAVRLRYMHEERDGLEALERVMIDTPGGATVPLGQLAEVAYVRGPQMIRSEDTFLTSYVLFDRRADVAEVDAVEAAEAHLAARIESGELEVPAGVSFAFAGTYEAQQRSEERLGYLVPIALTLVMVLLYLQFRRVSTVLFVYAGVLVAVGGGFLALWLYGQPWFLDVSVLGVSLCDLFAVGPVNLSTAVWVGVIALVGLATDDGVVMSTYLEQRFREPAKSVEEVRTRVLEAGQRRVRACLMTTATTLLALLPILTARGAGADVMRPMALPVVGGMSVELITLFVVPVLYAWAQEARTRHAALERPTLLDHLVTVFPTLARVGPRPNKEETPS